MKQICVIRMLDEAKSGNPADTIYSCCTPSIDFMVAATGIEANGRLSIVGRLYFTKTDWTRWHEWYKNKFDCR